MALIFTAVKMNAGTNEANFLVSGAVKSLDELVQYKPYQDFLRKITKKCTIETRLAVYQYGEGEEFDATIEELAYFSIRMHNDVSFLENHCKFLDSFKLPAIKKESKKK